MTRLEALIISAKAGTDVRIMIPCMPDHIFVYRATQFYAKYLVENGVKVYQYMIMVSYMLKPLFLMTTSPLLVLPTWTFRSFKLNF